MLDKSWLDIDDLAENIEKNSFLVQQIEQFKQQT